MLTDRDFVNDFTEISPVALRQETLSFFCLKNNNMLVVLANLLQYKGLLIFISILSLALAYEIKKEYLL